MAKKILMLSFIFLYFIGKPFYQLAGEYNKHQWGYAILGVVSYYAATFIGGVILALFIEYVISYSIDNINDKVLGLMAIPFGVLGCWGTYKLLQKSWSKTPSLSNEDVLDADIHN